MLFITPLGVPILTWAGIRIVGAFCLVMGIAGSLVVPLFLHLVDQTKAARARRAREYPAEARRRIGELSDRLLLAEDRCRELEDESAQLRQLNAERHVFNRSHDARVHAVQAGHRS